MKNIISIPSELEHKVRSHLFQSPLEQGAFLFARIENISNNIIFNVENYYLVPKEGWQIQHAVYLEMKDSERAKIMNMARQGDYAAIDCHSHPDSRDQVCFSPSDQMGITDFAAYARWKLNNKPFAAMVWGETSLDAVAWSGDFKKPATVDQVVILGKSQVVIKPSGSWYLNEFGSWWRRILNGKRAV